MADNFDPETFVDEIVKLALTNSQRDNIASGYLYNADENCNDITKNKIGGISDGTINCITNPIKIIGDDNSVHEPINYNQIIEAIKFDRTTSVKETVGDGTCFIHAILTSLSKTYRCLPYNITGGPWAITQMRSWVGQYIRYNYLRNCDNWKKVNDYLGHYCVAYDSALQSQAGDVEFFLGESQMYGIGKLFYINYIIIDTDYHKPGFCVIKSLQINPAYKWIIMYGDGGHWSAVIDNAKNNYLLDPAKGIELHNILNAENAKLDGFMIQDFAFPINQMGPLQQIKEEIKTQQKYKQKDKKQFIPQDFDTNQYIIDHLKHLQFNNKLIEKARNFINKKNKNNSNQDISILLTEVNEFLLQVQEKEKKEEKDKLDEIKKQQEAINAAKQQEQETSITETQQQQTDVNIAETQQQTEVDILKKITDYKFSDELNDAATEYIKKNQNADINMVLDYLFKLETQKQHEIEEKNSFDYIVKRNELKYKFATQETKQNTQETKQNINDILKEMGFEYEIPNNINDLDQDAIIDEALQLSQFKNYKINLKKNENKIYFCGINQINSAEKVKLENIDFNTILNNDFSTITLSQNNDDYYISNIETTTNDSTNNSCNVELFEFADDKITKINYKSISEIFKKPNNLLTIIAAASAAVVNTLQPK